MGIQLERLDSPLTPGAAGAPFLNTGQRRHVAVYLELLQKSLDEIETTIAVPATGRPGTIVHHEADLPAEFADVAAPIIQRLRERIGGLVLALRIPPKRRSRRGRILSILTDECIRAEDYFSSALAGYGPVDPMARSQIDPQLELIRADLTVLLESLAG